MAAGPVNNVHGAFAIPSLDGIRAVAVLVVFIGHGYVASSVWPGSTGVTIFFFLSGYLITTLLRREYERTGRISLPRFYLRRLLRITPPALLAIGVTTLVGVVALAGAGITIWGVIAEVFNVTNYYMIYQQAETGSAHVGLPPASSMLWSLAVEEHFYLVFPALMIGLLWRRLSMRRIGWVLVVACAVAPLWRLYLAAEGAGFHRLYIATDTRFDGLLAGAAMALLANPAMGDRAPWRLAERTLVRVVTPVAAVVFVATTLMPQSFGLTVGDTILYVCLVPLFWFVITRPDSVAGRVLNNRWVAHVGLLSFSLYLFHRLVLESLSQVVSSAPVIDIAGLAISLAIAQAVYVVVERPLGRIRKQLETRLPSRPAAA